MTSLGSPVGAAVTLAAADDLNGDPTNTATYLNLTGARRVIIVQAVGTLGTAGIDVIEVSYDGGSSWSAYTGLKTNAGSAVTGGILNAAGVEPTGVAQVFTGGGDLNGPLLMRCVRDAAVNAASVAWQTGAPGVFAIRIG